MGFDHICTSPIFAPGEAGDSFLPGDVDRAHPVFGHGREADEVTAAIAQESGRSALGVILDVVIDRVDANGAAADSRPDLFLRFAGERLSDPRSGDARAHAAFARLDTVAHARRLIDFWGTRLERLLQAGARGFRFLYPHVLGAELWSDLIGGIKARVPHMLALAWTPGTAWHDVERLAGAGFDGVFSSLPWWDYRGSWLIEEHDILRRVAPVLACPEAPFERRLAERLDPDTDLTAAYRRALRVAAAGFDGLMVPMGFERVAGLPMKEDASHSRDGSSPLDLGDELRDANRIVDRFSLMGSRNELRLLSEPDDPLTIFVRLASNDGREAQSALALVINPDPGRSHALTFDLDVLPSTAGAPLVRSSLEDEATDSSPPLAPAETRLVEFCRARLVKQRSRLEHRAFTVATTAPRIAIESISPAVDHGRFATKRLFGEMINVTADIFVDGHGVLAADVVWRAVDEIDWQHAPMRPLGNDRWTGVFQPRRVGRHEFSIEAWADEYAALAHAIGVKAAAEQDRAIETGELRRLVEDAAQAAPEPHRRVLTNSLAHDRSSVSTAATESLLAAETQHAMRAAAQRPYLARHEPAIAVEVERPQAGIGAWYELFPRSASNRPDAHGTFTDVIRRLPAIRAMGFDVLYFPPIHPIGTTHRKGRNNALRAQPDDPGSPYAIGSPEGGHDAIHPSLGTFEDFRALQRAAAEHGLEIALDFAVQCSLDHPWLKEHPEWFRWRPDGSIQFAENPPKKYEDIVNVEFYEAGVAVPGVWTALRDIVLFWVDRDVKIFRVDNPHTKPLPFWEWLIRDVRARQPDVIFLAEAFTRPKMMHRLAKIGFSQSYTYFTWRNTKAELTEYLTELSRPPVSDYFRANFFVNTPDINPFFLHSSGRAGFLIRAALASTLSGLWGMYSGFELCEAAPLPGREEYLDSEKYEIKLRDFEQPGNIVAEITRLNRIRKSHLALQQQGGLTFAAAYNDHVLVYAKSVPGHRDIIVVAVNLDPTNPQDATFELPLSLLGLPDHAAVSVTDLMRDRRFVWSGKLQRVLLDPRDVPFAVWRLARL